MPNRTTVALLMVQLPLTDLRALLPTDVGKSLRPVWLAGGAGINEGNADFLRGLGAVRKSVGADNGGWPPRQQYVRANSGLKFPTLAESLVGIGHSPSKEAASGLTVTKVDRRFFGASDSPRAFIEVVFTLSAFPDCAIPIADLLDAVAALQTRIAYRSNIRPSPVGDDHLNRQSPSVGSDWSSIRATAINGHDASVLYWSTGEVVGFGPDAACRRQCCRSQRWIPSPPGTGDLRSSLQSSSIRRRVGREYSSIPG